MEGRIREEVKKEEINFLALTPHELLAIGSSFQFKNSGGEKVTVNPANLARLRRDRAFYINEDHFVPVGVLSGEVSDEEIARERNRVGVIGGFTAFALFDEGSQELYFGAGGKQRKGFSPWFDLGKFDPNHGIRERVLHFKLRNDDPSQIATPEELKGLQLAKGYDQIYTRTHNDILHTIDIGVNPHAMQESIEYYLK